MAVNNSYLSLVLSQMDSDLRENFETALLTQDPVARQNLLVQLQGRVYPQSQNRYRFHEDDLIKAISHRVFTTCFQGQSRETLIAEAEKREGRSFYPLWKRVCWIRGPRSIAQCCRNTVFKIVMLAAAGYFGFVVGYQAYAVSQHFVSAVAIPYLINNTPIQIIRLFNAVMDLLNTIYRNAFKVVLGTWTIRQIALSMPEIPYFSPIARSLNPWKVYLVLFASPQTIGGFVFRSCWGIGKFTLHLCNTVAETFEQIADNAEAKRIEASEQAALRLWLQGVGIPDPSPANAV